MYKKGDLYMEDFFEEKLDFRELGVNCNAVKAYINTDRTYLKCEMESTSGQRVAIFTRQNSSNIIVYKHERNSLYESKPQVVIYTAGVTLLASSQVISHKSSVITYKSPIFIVDN